MKKTEIHNLTNQAQQEQNIQLQVLVSRTTMIRMQRMMRML
ncbi:hypothetical protein ACT3CE_18660 [Marinifilum sp. RC60d5]|nr:hypothetical protein [uncultured Marinifilum sp.]